MKWRVRLELIEGDGSVSGVVIADFWVTRTRRSGRVLKPDFGRQVIV